MIRRRRKVEKVVLEKRTKNSTETIMAPFPVQLNEVCKVRNAAVARPGSG
jgi:hypothetical protein